MSIQAVAEADQATEAMPPAPSRVKTLSMLPGHRLAVMFQDGTRGVAHLSSVLSSPKCRISQALKDPELFKLAKNELGFLTWPNGADLDPAWTHEQIRKDTTWFDPLQPRSRSP